VDCLAILKSGNYAFGLCRLLESKGYVFEVISTPCQIARAGCGYCLKFPEKYKDIVINEGISSGLCILEVYRVQPCFSKNKYIKMI
jgi:hypothetical protein